MAMSRTGMFGRLPPSTSHLRPPSDETYTPKFVHEHVKLGRQRGVVSRSLIPGARSLSRKLDLAWAEIPATDPGWRRRRVVLLQPVRGTRHPKSTTIQHVRVNHRRPHIAVAQQLLNRADIGAA